MIISDDPAQGFHEILGELGKPNEGNQSGSQSGFKNCVATVK